VASRQTKYGMEVEFKMPWKNFPNFKANAGEVIAVDAELCYSDGGPRVDRYFAYGSPLSVQQPASLAKVQLVERMERDYWKQCGAVMMPLRCDTAWGQPTKPRAHGIICLPPNNSDTVGKIVFHLVDLAGKTLGDFEAKKRQPIQTEGNFITAIAHWPVDVAPPGGYHVTAIVYDRDGNELTRVAPRLVSTSMRPGY